MKKLGMKLLLVAISFALCFLFAEVMLRMLKYSAGMYHFDRNTNLLTLNPNSKFFYTKSCFQNQVEVNSEGFHDTKPSIEKQAGTYRILVVGDSYVEALQVPTDKTFYNLLEQKLNNEFPDKKFEVYGIGKSGNGTYQNYQYYQAYGEKYKPDLIIDSFLVGNDFRDDSLELSKLFSKEAGYDVVNVRTFAKFDDQGNLVNPDEKLNAPEQNVVKKIAEKSVFLTWAYRSYREILNRKYFNANSSEPQSLPILDNQVYLKSYPDVWNEAWQIENNLLRTFNNTASKNGSKFLLVSLTEGYRINPEPNENLDYDKPENKLNEISTAEHFSYLPLLPVFRQLNKETGENPHLECDGHWNETGHLWAANTIFDYLKNHPELISTN
jgi:hypothetical protein